MRISKTVRAGALLLVAALAAAGCTSGSNEAELPGGEDPADAVAVSEQAQWTAGGLGVEKPKAVALRGDTALVAGDASLGDRLVAADVDTGEVRWVADSEGSLGRGVVLAESPEWEEGGSEGPGRLRTVGSGEDWSVLVEYATVADDEPHQTDVGGRGVAALSGKDGSVRWKQRLPMGKDSDQTEGIRVLDARDGTVLVAVESQQRDTVITYALDADAGGRELWHHKGEVGHFAGKLVLGHYPSEDGLDGTDEVFAVDARNGEQRWGLAGEYDSSSLSGAVDGRAVVRTEQETEQGERLGYRVLDTRTGEQVDSLGGEDTGPYFSDCETGRGLLTCVDSSEPELLTIRAGKHNDVVRSDVDIDPDSLRVDAVHASRSYLSWTELNDEGKEKARHTVVDRNGKLLREDLPGRVVAASDKHVATVNGKQGDDAELAVHRAKDGESAPSAKPPAKPDQSPLAYSSKSRWGFVAGLDRSARHGSEVRDSKMSELASVELAGDTLLYSGDVDGEKEDPFRFVAKDVRSGEQRWKLDERLGSGAVLDRFAPHALVGGGDRGTLLLEYESDGGQGVAAVALRDGETLWKKQVTEDTEADMRLRAADQKHFLVSLSGAGETRTLSYAIDGPRMQWTRKGVTAPERNGDIVVADQPKGSTKDGESERGPVVGLDAKTGKRQWDTGDRYGNPSVLGTFGRAVVVGHDGGMVVLRAADGKVLGQEAVRPDVCSGTPDRAKNAASDPPAMLICEVFKRGEGSNYGSPLYPVSVEATADGVRIRQLPGLSDYRSFHGLGRQMSATKGSYDLEEKQQEYYRVMDASGRKLAAKRPGAVIAADKRHVVRLQGRLGPETLTDMKVTVHDRK